MSSKIGIYKEVEAERQKQDEQWGGPEHDDKHDPRDFVQFILYQISLTNLGTAVSWRKRFIKIAALAVAAVERLDRG